MQSQASSEEPLQNNTTLKLRDSCNACAVSKLKCNKEKPTCSRCAKKKIACNYVATKRKGRKRAQSSQSTALDRPSTADASPSPAAPKPIFNPLSRLEMWFAADYAISIEDYLSRCADSTDENSRASTPYPALSDNLMPMQLSDFATENDETLHLLTPQMLELLNCDVTNGVDQASADVSEVAGRKDANSDSAGSLAFFENSVIEPALRSDVEPLVPDDVPRSRRSEADSCCMLQVMAIVKQAFSNSSNSCENLDAMDICGTPGSNVFATNQQTINVIGEVLKCSCSQDGFILVMMSLIILRVLGQYISAARRPHLWCGRSGDSLGTYSPLSMSVHAFLDKTLSCPAGPGEPDEDDPAYMAAQRVLSELPYVQRLVNQLSIKLQNQGFSANMVGEIQISELGQQEDKGNSLPLPLGLFDQLNTDIRRNLKFLAGEVIATLRRE
ncbi:uncharacterized protein TrAFT101_012030 [Trichoderma asperellum]|uniref:Zn(2)-C6 fungal-type domain-containing protein n=1 Tax=Trichoderma asperellum (strain ATCC 204424 / CBS 433.97 / NBRC 101777) TaxID=1042311 RepID=A0A2T3YR89_TRIA4|nr:hypothetical protein M441DRAFT_63046 [Trichoderma asperellum CBS 433.97]PTB35085.1 hypothetical protein M441DRAFT_63046 [Trichoderma asperellum CBS 433.97]UKZ91406.1 hypothetical protein TrAFT101_012030 [Trichoderma asperellum]